MVQEIKQMRNLLGILKDKTSLIKIALSIKRPVHMAVIRATTHSSNTSPPPEYRVLALITLSHRSGKAASACVEAILDRLHKTKDAYVALKCLFTLHQIIRRGSFAIKEQLSFYPCTGGQDFLNLSMFRDGRDSDTWQLSEWVRWYAGVLDHNLMASRLLGTCFLSPTTKSKNQSPFQANSAPESNSDVLRKTDVLVSMVEQISRAPESLQYQRSDLVYEIVNLVGEDYRSSQQQIQEMLSQFRDNIEELSFEEMNELVRCLKRLEDCRERLKKVFVNRKRNDAFWELARETKMRAEKLAAEREKMRWLVVRKENNSELTRTVLRLPKPSQGLWSTNRSQKEHYYLPPPTAC